MSSVGPQLPPHLAKRKRSADDEEPNSPPRKVQAATVPRTLGSSLPPASNPDALDLGESSEDDYGPAVGPARSAESKTSTQAAKRVLGPAMPPEPTNPDALDLEDSDDDYGPSMPVPISKAVPEPKRVIGPAPPPAPLSKMPSHPANDDSSDSEDDYGPSLPPTAGSAAEAALFEQQEAEDWTSVSAAPAPEKSKRAEWMLAPPTEADSRGRVDPTKIKSRKFNSGKGAKAPTEKSGISAIWTETPEEKRQRLEDEVLGRKDAATSSRASQQAKPDRRSREDEATERRIREYNEKHRSKSLWAEKEAGLEKAGKKVEDDDPSKRAFDREKDMALGGRMGNGQKKEMLAKAADLGSRFQRGKYL